MRRLLGYMRPYALPVAVSLVFLLINSILQVVGPLLTRYAVDRYLAPARGRSASWLDSLLSADPWTGLTQVSGLYLGAIVAVLGCEFVESWLMQWTGQHAMFDLRCDLMRKLHHLDLSYYDQTPVGRMVTRVTTDVDTLNELFTSGLVTIIGDTLVLIFLVAAMLRLSPGMTLMLLGVLPFVVIATMIFRRKVQRSYRQIRIAIARINSYIQEHVNGIAVLQLFNREPKSMEEFREINRQHMLAFKESIVAYGWFYPVVEFLGMLALALLLAYGGFQIVSGSLTLGVMIAFFQYGMRFFRPIQDLSEKYNILQSAMAAAERVFKLLDTPIHITSPAHPVYPPRGPSSIEFDHVWFAYRDEEWVLRDVTFHIAPGETVAVVGHTGAGKTTLINLLLRFYDIQRGAIRLNGVDIRQMDLADLRSRFGVVLQDPYLFTGTIESNIRLGTDWIKASDVERAAQLVNLDGFIESLPERYDQPVRERGNGYSTGQKQLISFARALAHSPQILVLDEATSSVDTDTELRIREALDHMVEGRTSIIIAHRLSTVQKADRILVLHKGQLREMGTHAELLALRGIYWKLYRLQYKDQERPAPAVQQTETAPR